MGSWIRGTVRALSVAAAILTLALPGGSGPPAEAVGLTLTPSQGFATASGSFFGTSFPSIGNKQEPWRRLF